MQPSAADQLRLVSASDMSIASRTMMRSSNAGAKSEPEKAGLPEVGVERGFVGH
jgi:hypothetical protein